MVALDPVAARVLRAAIFRDNRLSTLAEVEQRQAAVRAHAHRLAAIVMVDRDLA